MITGVNLEGDFLVFEIDKTAKLKILLNGEINMKQEGCVVTYTIGPYTIIHDSKVPFLETFGWGRIIKIKSDKMSYDDGYNHGCIETSLLRSVSAFMA
jgi:hypothetical protein